jgi:nucleoid-associated protein YgaU
MPKAGRSILLLLLVLSFAGCATQNNPDKKYSFRGYIADEARVDQEITGKVGNWENAPDAVDVERKPTRQVYYLELTKEAEEADKTITEIEETTDTETTVTSVPVADEPPAPTPAPEPRYNIPSFDDEPAMPSASGAAATGFKSYKVEKDDTLQKISMKFYNTNNKWPQIYEANKDIIKNPNFIKPGITIRIPTL